MSLFFFFFAELRLGGLIINYTIYSRKTILIDTTASLSWYGTMKTSVPFPFHENIPRAAYFHLVLYLIFRYRYISVSGSGSGSTLEEQIRIQVFKNCTLNYEVMSYDPII
jgi:hypothetical protein